MEYIDGVDGYKLLRRLRQENITLPTGVAVHVAREVLHALASVHQAKNPQGEPLGIVHRDVSPSNIYLSKDGRVKLGDFGIARALNRVSLRSEGGQVLKGKFAYLAPEQVAGEESDQRADLFSLGTILAEMLMNQPLFPGGGQLAVLLAIRDCKTEALDRVAGDLPAGLYDVLKKALARDPKDRYPSAEAFGAALAEYETDVAMARRELASRVRWVESSSSSDKIRAVRESVGAMRAARASASQQQAVAPAKPPASPDTPRVPPVTPNTGPDPDSVPPRDAPPKSDESSSPSQKKTGQYTLLPSFVEFKDGTRAGPWTFAKLMEALATGAVGRGDRLDFMGRGMKALEEIEELARFLPPLTPTTGKLGGPGAPDFQDDLASVGMLDILMRVLAQQESGVIFAERAKDDKSEAAKKELYFLNGKLHHVASSNASELLGEYLVRRGKLAREELDLALAVLPRYGGRMGDTLISLGLVGPVDIFRAIREQGRDRVAEIFLWPTGRVSFYRGHQAPHVEFPLDLDLPSLMLAGLEASKPTDAPVDEYRPRLDHVLAPGTGQIGNELFTLGDVQWPPVVARVRALLREPKKLRDVLQAAAKIGQLTAGDVLRAVEILLAANLLRWQ
jgi:serine/threonine-protein kinase